MNPTEDCKVSFESIYINSHPFETFLGLSFFYEVTYFFSSQKHEKRKTRYYNDIENRKTIFGNVRGLELQQ